MAFEYFNLLTNDLKTIVYDNVADPKDIVKLCASHKLCDDFKLRVSQALYEENYRKVESILSLFHEDCFETIASALKNDIAMRHKHYDLFVNAYQGTNVIQTEDDFVFYDEECELVEEHCDCTFNKLRLLDVYDFKKEENMQLKQRAMDFFFDMVDDFELIDDITLTFESGIVIRIECCKIYVDDHYINVAIDDNRNDRIVVRKYELGNNYKDTTWVLDVMSVYKKFIAPQTILGKLKSIDYDCKSGHMWRFAYFRLERLPIYESIINNKK
jgi:hypothetical protein